MNGAGMEKARQVTMAGTKRMAPRKLKGSTGQCEVRTAERAQAEQAVLNREHANPGW